MMGPRLTWGGRRGRKSTFPGGPLLRQVVTGVYERKGKKCRGLTTKKTNRYS